jgi:hypothetical protein
MDHVVLANAVCAGGTVPAFEHVVIVAVAFNHAATISGQSFKNN